MKYINNKLTKIVVSVGPFVYGVFYGSTEIILHALKIPHWH